tara:strand:- start:812 stop:1555 length:744 start_codon:yes stop_codon:yes gene_type:complete
MLKPLIIIPSRLGSTRLQEKALKIINGQPMIWHVWSNALKADLGPVVVATDSKKISNVIDAKGGNAILTDTNHHSGSDRVYEALCKFDPNFNYDLIINLQGDMPIFDPKVLQNLVSKIKSEDITTLVCKANLDEISDPNVVKAVISWDKNDKDNGTALYFSRTQVPYNALTYWHHIGIYAWKRKSLKKFISFPVSNLEKTEKLEQLRALENGMIIKAVKTKENFIGVDTQKDLNKVRNKIKNKSESN